MPSMLLDAVSPNDNESAVERSIRATKAGFSYLVQQLPCRGIPLLMVKRLVGVATRNLNQFPAENGLPDECSPLTVASKTPPQSAQTSMSISVTA